MKRIINKIKARILIKRLKQSNYSDKVKEIVGEAIRKTVMKNE